MNDENPLAEVKRKPLALEDFEARLKGVNLRMEKHGQDDVLACDLKFEAEAQKDVIDQLALAPHSYWLDTNDAPPAGLWDGIKLDVKHEKLRVRLSDDLPDTVADVAAILTDATLDQVAFTPRHGACADVTFRVRALISAEQCGPLAIRMKRDLVLAVERQQADMLDDAA